MIAILINFYISIEFYTIYQMMIENVAYDLHNNALPLVRRHLKAIIRNNDLDIILHLMFVFYSYHAQEWMHKVHYIIVTLATLRTNKNNKFICHYN